jgi:lipoprotein
MKYLISKSLFTLAVSFAAASVLGGCGFIKKPMTSEATLLDRAEMATGIDKSNLTVVPDSVKSEIDSVHYKVRSKNGDLYRCYFSSVIVVDSDVLCTKIVGAGGTGGSKSGNCNALLKKAGKC